MSDDDSSVVYLRTVISVEDDDSTEDEAAAAPRPSPRRVPEGAAPADEKEVDALVEAPDVGNDDDNNNAAQEEDASKRGESQEEEEDGSADEDTLDNNEAKEAQRACPTCTCLIPCSARRCPVCHNLTNIAPRPVSTPSPLKPLRDKFIKKLREKIRQDRKELQQARNEQLHKLLDRAQWQQQLYERKRQPKGKLITLPSTIDTTVKRKQEAQTLFTLQGKKQYAVSHSLHTLDSKLVHNVEKGMPVSNARVLIDDSFANFGEDEGKLTFMSSKFDTEGKTPEELQEYHSMFDTEHRVREISKGPLHKRQEADEMMKRALEFWKASPLRHMSVEEVTELMMEVFSEYYEPDLRIKVQKFFENPASASEPVFAAPKPDLTCDPIKEPTHPTLEGDDPEYLKAVDTFRNLYCSRCKVFICNRHLEHGYDRGSLQIQYESAMEEERFHRRNKSTRELGHFLVPKYKNPGMPRRKELSTFQKAICRRLFLIYEGNLSKVAIFLNVKRELVKDFCQGLHVPPDKKRRFIKPLPPRNSNAWYSLKAYPTRIYRANSRTDAKDRDAYFPCFHDLPCENPNSGCTCIKNKVFCTKYCVRGAASRNFFRGCQCKGVCGHSCTCRDNRTECDPYTCLCDACKDPGGKPTTTQRCQNDNITMQRRRPTYVAVSQIPDAGFGLYNRYMIPKGAYIDEYLGEVRART